MAQTKPLLDDMRGWMNSLLPTLSGKSALAGAIQYAFRWSARGSTSSSFLRYANS